MRAWDEAQTAETRAWLEQLPGREALRARARELLSVGSRRRAGLAQDGGAACAATSTCAARARRSRRCSTSARASTGVDRVLIDPAPLSSRRHYGHRLVGRVHRRRARRLGPERGRQRGEHPARARRGHGPGSARPHPAHAPRERGLAARRQDVLLHALPGPGRGPGRRREVLLQASTATRIGPTRRATRWSSAKGRDKLDIPAVVVVAGGPVAGRARAHGLAEERGLGARSGDARLDLRRPWLAAPEVLYEPLPLDDVLYILTNEDAPRYRVFAVDWAGPARSRWREVLRESGDVLADFAVVGGDRRVLVASYLHEATARIERFSGDGEPLGPVAAARARLGRGARGAWDGGEAFLDLTSFATPWQVLRIDSPRARRRSGTASARASAPSRCACRCSTRRARTGPRPHVPGRARGRDAKRRQAHRPVRLRRLQHRPVAELQRARPH